MRALLAELGGITFCVAEFFPRDFGQKRHGCSTQSDGSSGVDDPGLAVSDS
jgi:hypothetical protein